MKYKLPKGFKEWKRVAIMPFGCFAVIASRSNTVCIFSFDGESEMPYEAREYAELTGLNQEKV